MIASAKVKLAPHELARARLVLEDGVTTVRFSDHHSQHPLESVGKGGDGNGAPTLAAASRALVLPPEFYGMTSAVVTAIQNQPLPATVGATKSSGAPARRLHPAYGSRLPGDDERAALVQLLCGAVSPLLCESHAPHLKKWLEDLANLWRKGDLGFSSARVQDARALFAVLSAAYEIDGTPFSAPGGLVQWLHSARADALPWCPVKMMTGTSSSSSSFSPPLPFRHVYVDPTGEAAKILAPFSDVVGALDVRHAKLAVALGASPAPLGDALFLVSVLHRVRTLGQRAGASVISNFLLLFFENILL